MRVCRAELKWDFRAYLLCELNERGWGPQPHFQVRCLAEARGNLRGGSLDPAEAGVRMCSFLTLTCYLVGSGSIHLSLKFTGVV